jgi:hypothetical protein
MPIEQVFACCLGPVTGSEEGPPHFVWSDTDAPGDGWVELTRLQNRSFSPIVETDKGW